MSYLMDLPPELQEKFFSFCDVDDLKNVACCNSTLKYILKTMLWSTIVIPCESLLNIDWIMSGDREKLENFQYTKALRFYVRSGEELDVFENFEKILTHCNPAVLETLRIHSCVPSLILACHLLTGLKNLDLSCFDNIPDNAFTEISKLNLSQLNLSDTNTDNINLPLLSNGLRQLKHLNLSFCSFITDEGISNVKKFTQLNILSLNACMVSDTALSHVSALSSLQHLDITDTDITDQGLKRLTKLQSLKGLYLGGCGVTDLGMLYLSTLTWIEKLDVGRTGVTDDGISHLCALANLRVLEISLCGYVTDVSVHHICKLRSLEILDISYINITDVALRHICNLQSLKYLDITRDNITDAGLHNLSKLASLKTLKCSRTRITEDAISPFRAQMAVEWKS